MLAGFGSVYAAGAALVVVAVVLAVARHLSRRLAALDAELRGLKGCLSCRIPEDGGLARLAVQAPGSVLERLGEARRQGERQLDLQRNQFELSKCMRGDQEPDALAASILNRIAQATGAPAGAFYLGRPGQRLVLAASLGVDPAAPPPPELRMGQGPVGRIAAQRRLQAVRDGAGQCLRIAGADGPETPRCLVVVPYHLVGRIKGVLVLGWRRDEADGELEFLRQSAESIAMALDSANARVRVRRLLEATRNQAVVLARQQQELQASNAELARADRYKSEFLANMSHELRTPLNSMLIMSQVLAENRGGNLTADETDAALTINRAGNELLMIINDILDMSRVEAGKLDLNPEELLPQQLVADLEDLFLPVAQEQGVALVTGVAPEAPARLTSDPLRLSQILKNLLNNAFKFTEQGSVSLTVRPPREHEFPAEPVDGPWIAFAVTDTGIGMSPETAARVCEPFYQGDGSMGRRHGGSGLGLSICARLAHLLGGHLTIDSTKGRGSTFVLVLPTQPAGLAPEVAETPPPVAPPAVPAGPDLGPWTGRLAGCTVLLADDDMRTVFGLSPVLDAMEAKVHIARDAAEALAIAERQPDLDLLCLAPGLFRERPDDLRRLLTGGGPGARACLWLGPAPSGAAALPVDALTLEKPLDAARVAEACTALRRGRTQPV